MKSLSTPYGREFDKMCELLRNQEDVEKNFDLTARIREIIKTMKAHVEHMESYEKQPIKRSKWSRLLMCFRHLLPSCLLSREEQEHRSIQRALRFNAKRLQVVVEVHNKFDKPFYEKPLITAIDRARKFL